MPRETNTSNADKAIDENLKRAFEDVANEPLPERFADLLDQLKKTGPGAKTPNQDSSE